MRFETKSTLDVSKNYYFNQVLFKLTIKFDTTIDQDFGKATQQTHSSRF